MYSGCVDGWFRVYVGFFLVCLGFIQGLFQGWFRVYLGLIEGLRVYVGFKCLFRVCLGIV